MEAAEAAAQQIFAMARRQAPPWTCCIAERDDGEAFARVAVRATCGNEVLTLVAQVEGGGSGELKFFRREGLERLEDINTSMMPYDADSLEECWEDG